MDGKRGLMASHVVDRLTKRQRGASWTRGSDAYNQERWWLAIDRNNVEIASLQGESLQSSRMGL